MNIPPGCRFAGRCPHAVDACRSHEPALREVWLGHQVACHRVGDEGAVLYG